jgi:hypothetical protein
LRTRERVTLRGDFSFDAVSPDGEFVYLIEYTSRTDPTRYRVRAYDAVSDRLLPGPIVDPREPDERMRGYPITRATSPDGRWEYTLYDGAGSSPFVHALDTQGRKAVCIDLDGLAGRTDLYDLPLDVAGDGATLTVGPPAQAVLAIDTATFRVAEARPEAGLQESSASTAQPTATPAGAEPGPVAWVLVLGATAAVCSVAVAVWLARRRRAGQVDPIIDEG